MRKTTTYITNTIENESKDKREERTPLKEVFQPFQTEVNRDVEKNFIADFKTKRNEIRSLFNSNVGFKEAAMKDHQPFKIFKRGMAKALFGTRIFNGGLSYLSQLFTRKKTSRTSTKIDIGNLLFFDLQSNAKTSLENRLIEVKKMYFKRSKNFSVLDNNKQRYFKMNALSKSSKGPLNLKTVLTNGKKDNQQLKIKQQQQLQHIRSKSRNIDINLNREHNNYGQGVIGLSTDNFNTESTRHYCDTQGDNYTNNHHKHFLSQDSHINPNTNTNTNFHNYIITNDTHQASPSKASKTSKKHYSSFIQSPTTMSLRDLKLKKKTLKQEIKSMSDKHDLVEKQLFNILDQGRDYQKKNKHIIKLEKLTNIDFKKDIEVILDIKVKQPTKVAKTKDLLNEALEVTKKNQCKNAIIKLSDGITKMNDETALKFAESIVQDYYKKTQSGTVYIPKKRIYERVNLDMKLRNKVGENFAKLQRMAVLFNRTKNKMIDEQKEYEEQQEYLKTQY